MVNVSYQSIPFFSAVWDFDGSSYIDRTIEAKRPGGTPFSALNNTNSFLYLGSESRFDLAAFLLANAGSLGTLTMSYSSSPTSWTQFVPDTDTLYAADSAPYFEPYDFTSDGAIEMNHLVGWTARAFSSSDPHNGATPPDTNVRYWIRISAASVSTAPQINQILMRPYAAYCRYTDVANLLQLDTDFSATTAPTAEAVEDAIHAAQSRIDQETHKSWRIGYVTNEHHEFNLAGFKLARPFAWNITRLQVWDGAGWQTRTKGRGQDYFLVPDLNFVQWSRYFILPARFHSTVSSLGWWGWGEFVMPVRVNYLYGRNRFSDDREGSLVFDICRKLAAIDLVTNTNYSIWSISGSDKVAYDRKIEIWKNDISERLDSLKAWIVF